METSDLDRLVGLAGRLARDRARWMERFAAEARFAERLIALHAAKAHRWHKLLDEAVATVAGVFESGADDRLPDAVRDAERIMEPIGEAAKGYTIHCAGHAHIDMNWLWSWPETVAVTNDTFTTVVALMQEFEDFCFTQSQASVYEIVRRYNPELLEQIKRRVAEGRWEVAAAHWVEGDKNLASGESLARHLLYARRFTREMFGFEPEALPLDWEPDTFGHARTIPSIVSRGAVTRYFLCRSGPAERPPVFWWQGPDGARVLVYRSMTGYGDHIGPHNARALLDFCQQTGMTEWMCVYGVGDHGGGPTRRDVLRAHEMDAWPVFPNYRLSTTNPFYVALEENGDRWAVVEDELNFEFTGCYTSQSRIKTANRLGESYCLEAEAAAALACRTLGRPYPAEQLREAWTNILFGHFHDILPGSGVAATRHYQLGLFQQTAAATGVIRAQSLRAVAQAVDTSFVPAPAESEQEGGAMGAGVGFGSALSGISSVSGAKGGTRPFVVFNPTAWKRDEVVTAIVWDPESTLGADDPERMSFVVRGSDGGPVPAQKVASYPSYWGHRAVELAFPASVGPLAWTAYAVEEGRAPEPEGGARCIARQHGWERQPIGAIGLANEHLEVEFDRATGGVVKLLDRASGRDLASPAAPLALPEYVVEKPRGMSAWIMGDVLRRVCPLEVLSVEPGLMGPYVASVIVKARLGESRVTLTFSLKAGQPALEVAVRLRWVELGGPEGTPALRMFFPLALSQARATYEIPFGALARDLCGGEEVPALRWADVRGVAADGQPAGCALLNNCRHGHSLDGSALRLTLVRSSSDPDPFPEVGEHDVRMALVPHGEAPAVADLMRLGAAFEQALQVVATDVHAGGLPAACAGAVQLTPNGCVLTAVKRCEDDDGLIFRILEAAGESATARVKLDARVMGRPVDAVEVDLLERPLERSTARVQKDGYTVQVPPHGIAGVKVTFE